jgi:hypothetical protein
MKNMAFDPYCVFGGGVRVFTIHEFKIFTKYESRIIIQESDGEIANTATKIRVLISRICVCILH